jgi:protein-L-isoaspartate(D-aspartate) O-methyltransferase
MSESPTWVDQARRALAEDLRARGAIRTQLVYDVSRHLFLPVVYRRRGDRLERHRLTGADPCDGELAYQDRTLVTRADDGGKPVSSSTAPSVMAFMLEALALRPGLRVLEIGCGTGYNAALLHAAGCDVVTVDPLRSEVEQARDALQRHGATGVSCLVADGYGGAPEGGPYDRVIVSCAIAGIPPGWLEHCRPAARLVAPLAHGGIDMLVRIEVGAAGVTIRPLGGAGYFINAQGPLYPAALQPRTEPFGEASARASTAVVGYPQGYHDMWFAAAVDDSRVTSVYLAGNDSALGRCGLVEADSAAVVRVDGSVAATGPAGPALARAGAGLVADWAAAGRPRARSWSAHVRPHSRAMPPLLVSHGWRRDAG